jgi:hypothetical protein
MDKHVFETTELKKDLRKQEQMQRRVPDRESGYKMQSPYWKRVHHDWRFWIALLLMIAAMVIYVMSEDFAWLPRNRPQLLRQTPTENSRVR